MPRYNRKKPRRQKPLMEYFNGGGGAGGFSILSFCLCCLCCIFLIGLIFGIFRWYTSYKITKQRYSLASDAMKSGNTKMATAMVMPEVGAGIGLGIGTAARGMSQGFSAAAPHLGAMTSSIGKGLSGAFKLR